MAWWVSALSICLMAGVLMGADKPEIVAHRGESADAPENTLASFNLAWERQDDAVELDIHLTGDGQVIVSHDARTGRTTNTDLVIKDSTLEQLRKLDAGSWKDPRYAGEKLPLLSEVLAMIPDGRRCFVEIKVGPEIIPALRQVIDSSGIKAGQLVIISFRIDVIEQAKKTFPHIKCYLLAGTWRENETRKVLGWHMLGRDDSSYNVPTLAEVIRIAKEIGADGVDLDHNGPLGEHPGEQIHAAGIEFHVWTIDDPETAKKMVKAGVDGITTNKAQWIREQLGLYSRRGMMRCD